MATNTRTRPIHEVLGIMRGRPVRSSGPSDRRRMTEYAWLAAGALTLAALGARRGLRRRTMRKVKDVMIQDVVSVSPLATLVAAAQIMKDANVGVLPIVDGGVTRGLVTDRDLVIRGIARGADPAATLVGECATTDLVCARPDADVGEAMDVMARLQIGRLPVVDEDRRLLGIVTLSSLALRAADDDDAFDAAKQVSRRAARAT